MRDDTPKRRLPVWMIALGVLGVAIVVVLARPMLGKRSDQGANGGTAGGHDREAHGKGGAALKADLLTGFTVAHLCPPLTGGPAIVRFGRDSQIVGSTSIRRKHRRHFGIAGYR